MKRVLLTGASGFIGREAPQFLADRGFEVHTVGRSLAKPAPGVVHHRCDLLRDDPTSTVRAIAPDHLLHLAWYAEPGLFWDAAENLDWVAGSLRLVRAFAACGGRRAVLAGSCAEYDWSFETLGENSTPLRPATLYGKAKVALFRMLERAAPDLGLSLAWGRIFFPFGPLEKPDRLLGALFDGIARGEPVALTNGTQRRDFMHVDDVARAFVELLDSEVAGAVNIASGETVSVRELAERAARLAGGERLLRFGERASRSGDPPIMRAAVDRLRNELGFAPRFSLDGGLEDMLRRRPAHLQQESQH